jgi:hypothetical protein
MIYMIEPKICCGYIDRYENKYAAVTETIHHNFSLDMLCFVVNLIHAIFLYNRNITISKVLNKNFTILTMVLIQ